MKINDVLKSKYCWIVIFLSSFLGYFLAVRKLTQFTTFETTVAAVFYIIFFSFSNACLIRSIKDKTKSTLDIGTQSVFSIIISVLGYGALQSCTIGGSCGVSLFHTVAFTIFPASFATFFMQNGVLFLIVADIFLLASIGKMGCFRMSSNNCAK